MLTDEERKIIYYGERKLAYRRNANVRKTLVCYDVFCDEELSKTFDTLNDAISYAKNEKKSDYVETTRVSERAFFTHTCPCCGDKFDFCEEFTIYTFC